MSIEKEIERAVKRTIALDKDTPYKSAAEQEKIISDIKSAFNDATFHFENSKSLMLNQSGKKRLVKQYDNLYSPENILCQSIKQILDRAFKIKYPNRNKTTRTLFSVLSAAIQMSDFTIVKFDFKDYFNSVSSIYVFEKYLKYNILDRHEIDLIKAFAYSTKYAYAGLCTSNAIAEIIAGYFDEEHSEDRRTIVSFLLSTLLNNISKKKNGYTLFGKQRLGKALLLIDMALYVYAFYPSFDQARKIISIIAYMNSEIDFKGDDKAHTKLSRTINRYSFVFCSGNVFDLCDWFPFFYEYNIVLDTKTENHLIQAAEECNDPIIWANLLLYSQYYQPFFNELSKKVENIVERQILRISDKEPMMQVEFWYVLIFHNCPYISITLRQKMSDIINDIKTKAVGGKGKKLFPSAVTTQLICDFLEQRSPSGNKPEESLFNWKGIKNFADQITYRTYQRTVFKRYRKNTYGLYASLD